MISATFERSSQQGDTTDGVELPPPAALHSLGTLRVWAISAAIFIPFAWAFFASSAPFSIPEVEAACGQAPPDMRFFTGGEGVTNFLEACGPDGRNTYRNMQLADLIYPAVVGAFMASSLALAIRRLSPGAKVLPWLAALPLLGSLFDYVENMFAWLAIAAYPSPANTNGALGFASAAKTSISWVAGLALIICLVILGWRSVRDIALGRSSSRPATNA